MSGFRWIVNPGDFRDVVICSGRFEASDLYAKPHGSRLYRCAFIGGQPIWEEYTMMGGWMMINRDNLPIKVLEAGEK